MKALQLPEQKEFIHLLLKSEVFDNFLLSEVSVHTAVCCSIDGRINRAFYSEQELEEQNLSGLEYMPYGKLRSACYELIKGRRTPSYFKFVLMLSPDNLRSTLQAAGTALTPADISAACINIYFKNGRLMLTTSVSCHTFIPDKSFEHAWDKMVQSFLKKNKIIFLEI